jgi:lactate dehydrogenase-like 2-hydroxyacid dehydrogenase
MDMRVLGYDHTENTEFAGEYVTLEEMLAQSDLVGRCTLKYVDPSIA